MTKFLRERQIRSLKHRSRSLRQIMRGKFPDLLIVEQVAILIVVYLCVEALMHFRVEALAAAAAIGALLLAFVRHVTDGRSPALGAREPDTTGELPDSTLGRELHEHGEGCAITVEVVIVLMQDVVTQGKETQGKDAQEQEE
jgi:hypothetical protein